jgi:hypothetical protein
MNSALDGFSTREKRIFDCFISWCEPSDTAYREDFRDALYSTDELHFRLKALNLPGQELLEETWSYIESLCDDTSGNAYIISLLSKDQQSRFTAGWILFHMAESDSPHDWFNQSFLDQAFDLLVDLEGDSAYDKDDDWEPIMEPVLDLKVFKKVFEEFFQLAERGPRNAEGRSFVDVLVNEGLLV